MAVIDKNYHNLLDKIFQEGYTYEDPNRKGVNRLEIPSYTFRHDFKDGFPAITTKKLNYKSVVTELIWFLRGDTNIKYLVDNDCNIWNKDAYNYYKNQYSGPLTHTNDINKPFILEDYIEAVKDGKGSIKGNVGRIYGAQWRKWHTGCDSFGQKKLTKDGYEELDQISNLIKNLKERPLATNHIVTAWNPAELDDMALPPCHWSFEILVEPVGPLYMAKHSDRTKVPYQYNGPLYQFTLKWHQRSVDSFLGKM